VIFSIKTKDSQLLINVIQPWINENNYI